MHRGQKVKNLFINIPVATRKRGKADWTADMNENNKVAQVLMNTGADAGNVKDNFEDDDWARFSGFDECVQMLAPVENSLNNPILRTASQIDEIKEMNDVLETFAAQVFATLVKANWERFQVQTKRSNHLQDLSPKLLWQVNAWAGVSIENDQYLFRTADVPFFFKQWDCYDENGVRGGKKKAGRLLDGRLWEEMPM